MRRPQRVSSLGQKSGWKSLQAGTRTSSTHETVTSAFLEEPRLLFTFPIQPSSLKYLPAVPLLGVLLDPGTTSPLHHSLCYPPPIPCSWRSPNLPPKKDASIF